MKRREHNSPGMNRDKGLSGIFSRKCLLFGFLLLFFGVINPGIPEVRSNDCSRFIITKTYPLDIFKVDFPAYRSFRVKWFVTDDPRKQQDGNKHTKSKPFSDQTVFKEARSGTADRGPDPALLFFSGVSLCYLFTASSFIYPLQSVLFNSWTGNSARIRPPPII